MNLLVTVLIFIAQLPEIETFKPPYLPLLSPQFLNFSFKTAKSTAECLQQILTSAENDDVICQLSSLEIWPLTVCN